jgi:hypothetical protein
MARCGAKIIQANAIAIGIAPRAGIEKTGMVITSTSQAEAM